MFCFASSRLQVSKQDYYWVWNQQVHPPFDRKNQPPPIQFITHALGQLRGLEPKQGMEGWASKSEFSFFFFPSLDMVFEQEFPSSKYSKPVHCADKTSSPDDTRNSVMHRTLRRHSRKSTSCDKFAHTCMPTSIEIVREEETSIPSILASAYPKKNPEAWRQHTESTTCNPDERIAEAFWAIALPHKIATVATATNGIKGDTDSTRPLQYWFKMAPSRTGASTTCSHNHYGRV